MSWLTISEDRPQVSRERSLSELKKVPEAGRGRSQSEVMQVPESGGEGP